MQVATVPVDLRIVGDDICREEAGVQGNTSAGVVFLDRVEISAGQR